MAATGSSDARASAPSGPPDSRSAASPPTKAHHIASRAPAATDHEAAASTGRLGRAPAIDTNGTTDPWRSAAAIGMAMASAKRTEPSSGNGGTSRRPRRYAGAGAEGLDGAAPSR